ncbi:nitroreductase family protein [Methanorbis furvi]|uniref:NAD(P)H-quinone oxidoreductase subunit I, chloroplastic n=1 Tax=Methanorbis furvi TaxID=3028299 RepID=A0AAE4SA46_9EURY|nr:NAD(P)H-quinone oxidoreductase subunit I, chloroplastic [Methanocorpusculaceae archaeon Ag1]
MKSALSSPLTIICDKDACTSCGLCSTICTTRKITGEKGKNPDINNAGPCISCGHCIAVCPANALSTTSSDFTSPENIKAYHSGVDADLLAQYLKSRRSIRIWKDTPVAKEDIDRLLDIAAYAPSAANIHPVKWAVTADPKKVQEFTKASVAYLKTLPADHPAAGVAQMLIAGADAGGDPICRNAPALLIAASESGQDFGLIDSIIALSYIDIFAPSLKIGTCWVGYVMAMLNLKPDLGKILGIPDNWTPQYAMLIGYQGVAFSQIPPRETPEIIWN